MGTVPGCVGASVATAAYGSLRRGLIAGPRLLVAPRCDRLAARLPDNAAWDADGVNSDSTGTVGLRCAVAARGSEGTTAVPAGDWPSCNIKACSGLVLRGDEGAALGGPWISCNGFAPRGDRALRGDAVFRAVPGIKSELCEKACLPPFRIGFSLRGERGGVGALCNGFAPRGERMSRGIADPTASCRGFALRGETGASCRVDTRPFLVDNGVAGV